MNASEDSVPSRDRAPWWAQDRLSPLDAGFLHIEDEVSRINIGAAALMEGPAPPYERIRATVESKLDTLPRCRQRVLRVPLDLGLPVWADDPHFHVDHHLRRATLSGGNAATADLERWMADLMSRQMDRSRPLWEIWMVEGLESGRWALIAKAHHCLMDGVSGSNMLALMLDAVPDPPEPEVTTWVPNPGPTEWELAREGLSELASAPVRLLRSAVNRSLFSPPSPSTVSALLTGLDSALESVRRPTEPGLNGPIGPDRRWVTAAVGTDRIREIRRVHGGTFNDVVLALVTRGLRDLLLSRGQEINLPLRCAVPVSLGPRDDRNMAVGDGTLTNRVSLVLGELPVHLADSCSILEHVTLHMAALKTTHEAAAVESLIEVGGMAPPPLWAWAGRFGTRIQQRTVNTVTTNVPGPQVPLYAAGRRALALFPYVPIAMGIRIGVAVLSYDGTVGFGITGDRSSSSDIDVVSSGIVAAAEELCGARTPRTNVGGWEPLGARS